MKRAIRLAKELAFAVLKIKNFWLYILCRSKLVNSESATIKFRNGISYDIDPTTNQVPMINEIWRLGIYDPLLKSIKKDAVVIDIGANIGIFSIKAARAAENVKVFSFEPFSKNFSLFQKNIIQNNLQDKIFSFELAVGGKSGTHELYLRPHESVRASFKRFGDTSELSSVVVKTITLAEVFSLNKIENCDFLKMDCEGAEEEILENAPRDLFKKIQSMTIEWHHDINKMSTDKFKTFLNDLGYAVDYDASTLTAYAWRN